MENLYGDTDNNLIDDRRNSEQTQSRNFENMATGNVISQEVNNTQLHKEMIAYSEIK